MDYNRSLQYLNSFINYENNLNEISPKAFSLDRIKKLLDLLDNPEDHLRIIHVAGSKGKGSTCAMLGSILKHAGYRTGLYTSPHINDVRERVRVLELNDNGKDRDDDLYTDMISEKEFSELITRNRSEIDEIKNDHSFGDITFFEVLTVLALLYFKEKKTDFVILETGLGGRLDATNAVKSMVAAITPISLEHTHMLGDTLEKICNEKKAIIKSKKQKLTIASIST